MKHRKSCCRTVCRMRSDNPQRDGWSYIEFFDVPLKSGWWCPDCTKALPKVLEAHGVIALTEKAMTIGPDGTYPLGEPINEHDRGGLYARFLVIKHRRCCALEFKTSLDWLAAPPDQMRMFAAVIRQQTIKAFGKLPYNTKTLPIKVVANKERGVIELRLPYSTESLVANPEVWLALSDVISKTIAQF